MELKESKEFIGAVGLNDINKEHRRGEIGFWLLPEFWGKGYVREATPKVSEYGFQQFGLHRIEARVETENEGSRKALTNLGFKHEGTLQDPEFKNGRFISVDIFGLIVDNAVKNLFKKNLNSVLIYTYFRGSLLRFSIRSFIPTHGKEERFVR